MNNFSFEGIDELEALSKIEEIHKYARKNKKYDLTFKAVETLKTQKPLWTHETCECDEIGSSRG